MHIGHRLSFDGALCTVRFTGEVRNTTGTWLGVEWDDPTRGKHDGTHEGIRYFTCISKQPTAASFVRPTRPVDPRCKFLQALRRKYADVESAGHDNSRHGGATVMGVSAYSQPHRLRISGKEVEEVGFDKVQAQLADLRHLRVVLLDGMRIGKMCNNEQNISSKYVEGIRETCPEIVELDIGRNLFEEWREVLDIAAQLENLVSLGAGGNRFHNISIPTGVAYENGSAFKNVVTLNLDFTLLSWSDICHMVTVFPSLTALNVSSNSLSHLKNGQLQEGITIIDLHDNDFVHFSDLDSLSKLPNLKLLNLKLNSIRSIYSSSEEASSESSSPLSFSPTLTTLDLSYNAISSWHLIDSLPKIFPGLISLRVSHNPLYQSLSHPDGRYLSPADGYALTIARIASLTELNYGPIKPRDRTDAEAYYLSLIAAEISHAANDADANDARAAIISRHPRYSELISQDDDPTVSSADYTKSSIPSLPSSSALDNTLGANLLTITFRPSFNTNTITSSNNAALSSSSDTLRNTPSDTTNPPQPFTKQIPPSFSVYTVLGIVGKHLGIFPLNLKLIWETGDWDYVPDSKNNNNDDDDDDDGEWNSEDEDGNGDRKAKEVSREIEIKPGTRPIGTWIDVGVGVGVDVDSNNNNNDDDDDGDDGRKRRAAVVRVEVEERF